MRVVAVHLTGGGEITTRQTKYRIDEKLKVGDAKALFGKFYLSSSLQVCWETSNKPYRHFLVCFPGISLDSLTFSWTNKNNKCLQHIGVMHAFNFFFLLVDVFFFLHERDGSALKQSYWGHYSLLYSKERKLQRTRVVGMDKRRGMPDLI